jgi:hypothetical protein
MVQKRETYQLHEELPLTRINHVKSSERIAALQASTLAGLLVHLHRPTYSVGGLLGARRQLSPASDAAHLVSDVANWLSEVSQIILHVLDVASLEASHLGGPEVSHRAAICWVGESSSCDFSYWSIYHCISFWLTGSILRLSQKFL